MFKRNPTIDKKTKLILAGILLLAAFFRFYNSNWDNGNLFHPDERNIANAVSSITLFSQMDPKFYAYGGFLIYLYKFSADILALFFHNSTIAHDWGWINIIGRSYSAFFSTITIFPIYLLAAKVFSKQVGILACLIFALTVASIQTAHFSTTENLLTFMVVLITYLSTHLYKHPSKKLVVLIGLLLGISVATKTTGALFFLSPIIVLCIQFYKKPSSRYKTLSYFIMLGGCAFLVFSIFSPFTFLNWQKFLESMKYENGVVQGTNRVVYTLQFTHTIPYLFQIKNLFWQLGLFAIVAFIGTLTTIWDEVRKRRMIFLIFLSFPLAYFLYVGIWYTKFNRYMVPILPFLIILGSNLLLLIFLRYRRVGRALIILSVLITAFWALAFFSIYLNKQTRVSTSEWIYQNIPTGKFILSEHWDEGLPIPLPQGSPSSYKQLPLTIYEPDNDQKINYFADYLTQADYITINSRRLYGTLLYLPEKYPITQRYYQHLFSGKLGYKKIAEFSSYPTFMGYTINDDTSEETFQVYDHPKTYIFKNVLHLSPETIKQRLIK